MDVWLGLILASGHVTVILGRRPEHGQRVLVELPVDIENYVAGRKQMKAKGVLLPIEFWACLSNEVRTSRH